MNKKIVWIVGAIIIVGVIGLSIFVSPKEYQYEPDFLGIDYAIEGNETSLSYDTTNPVVAMKIQNYGSIVMELYPSVAPNTVNNFISLVKNGFYDNNSFHRLVPGFVLQGGDPTGTGSGGPGYSISGEFTANGFPNTFLHSQWVISMARGDDNDSAGSQFFICLESASNLDGYYASFGKVIDGFDVLKTIEKREKVANSNTGKLVNNLVIEKAVIDLKGKTYPEVVKVQ